MSTIRIDNIESIDHDLIELAEVESQEVMGGSFGRSGGRRSRGFGRGCGRRGRGFGGRTLTISCGGGLGAGVATATGINLGGGGVGVDTTGINISGGSVSVDDGSSSISVDTPNGGSVDVGSADLGGGLYDAD